MRPREGIAAGDLLRAAAARLAAAGIANARAEAEILLAATLRVARERLLGEAGLAVGRGERARLERLVRRRAKGEPSAYLAGEKEFFGRPFAVARGVLIPRPETECLVEGVLQWIRGPNPEARRAGSRARGADLGAGSGCIAVTLACEVPGLSVDAVERSGRAARAARENARRHGVLGRVRVLRRDFREYLAGVSRGSLDFAVSNPPYVAERELPGLDAGVRLFEPRDALVAGPTGLEAHRALLEGAARALRGGGLLALETGFAQAGEVATLSGADGCWRMVSILPDLSGAARGVLIERVGTRGV